MFAMAKSRQKTMDELLADSSDDELDYDDGEDGGSGGGKAGSRRGGAAAGSAAKKSGGGTFIQVNIWVLSEGWYVSKKHSLKRRSHKKALLKIAPIINYFHMFLSEWFLSFSLYYH